MRPGSDLRSSQISTDFSVGVSPLLSPEALIERLIVFPHAPGDPSSGGDASLSFLLSGPPPAGRGRGEARLHASEGATTRLNAFELQAVSETTLSYAARKKPARISQRLREPIGPSVLSSTAVVSSSIEALRILSLAEPHKDGDGVDETVSPSRCDQIIFPWRMKAFFSLISTVSILLPLAATDWDS